MMPSDQPLAQLEPAVVTVRAEPQQPGLVQQTVLLYSQPEAE